MGLVPVPASTTGPSCEGGALEHEATFEVGCDVPSRDPAFATVYGANGASHMTAPDAVADRSDSGGLPVRFPAPISPFCITIPANASTGSVPVVPVAGDLDYDPEVPFL